MVDADDRWDGGRLGCGYLEAVNVRQCLLRVDSLTDVPEDTKRDGLRSSPGRGGERGLERRRGANYLVFVRRRGRKSRNGSRSYKFKGTGQMCAAVEGGNGQRMFTPGWRFRFLSHSSDFNVQGGGQVASTVGHETWKPAPCAWRPTALPNCDVLATAWVDVFAVLIRDNAPGDNDLSCLGACLDVHLLD